MNEPRVGDHKVVITMKDGTTSQWGTLLDAMLHCWDVGRNKVKHITLDGGEPMEVVDIFK